MKPAARAGGRLCGMSPVSHRGRRRLDPTEPVERLRGLLAEDIDHAGPESPTEEFASETSGTQDSAFSGPDVPAVDDTGAEFPEPNDPPEQWRTPLRWRLPWPALLMAGLAVAAVVATVLFRVLGADGGAVTGTPEKTAPSEAFVTQGAAVPESAGVALSGVSPGGDGQDLVVHVVGEVRKPGVVEVAQGARVSDAVEAAGGLTDAAVVDGVNLAAPVSDGAQVAIPDAAEAAAARTRPPAPVSGTAGSGTAGASGSEGAVAAGQPPAVNTEADTEAGTAGLVNLNTATVAELEELPKVGPVLAQRIVDHRDQVGGFRSVAELDDVSGIGPAMMTALEPLVTV